jgi:hypothetical protein
MGRRHALGGRCATRLAGSRDTVGRYTVGRPAGLGRRLGLGRAARLGLGRLGLGPGCGWHCNRPGNWHGGGLGFLLLPVAAGMEPVGMGMLAVIIRPLVNPQIRPGMRIRLFAARTSFLAQK